MEFGHSVYNAVKCVMQNLDLWLSSRFQKDCSLKFLLLRRVNFIRQKNIKTFQRALRAFQLTKPIGEMLRIRYPGTLKKLLVQSKLKHLVRNVSLYMHILRTCSLIPNSNCSRLEF